MREARGGYVGTPEERLAALVKQAEHVVEAYEGAVVQPTLALELARSVIEHGKAGEKE